MTKNEERINKLFKELVPETGKADSLAGELVRAMSRIGYRFYNDGDSWASATARKPATLPRALPWSQGQRQNRKA